MVSTNISRQEKRLKSDGVSIKDMGRKPDLFKKWKEGDTRCHDFFARIYNDRDRNLKKHINESVIVIYVRLNGYFYRVVYFEFYSR